VLTVISYCSWFSNSFFQLFYTEWWLQIGSKLTELRVVPMPFDLKYRVSLLQCATIAGGSVAEWLACWTQAQKGPGLNRSRDAVG